VSRMRPIRLTIFASLGLFFTVLTLAADEKKKATQYCEAEQIIKWESRDIIARAEKYLHSEVRTVVHDTSERSSGGPNDFYSEGDYWWPDPVHPDGPYIRRDGESNPNNFIAHRQSLMRLGDIVGALSSAYLISDSASDRKRYADAIGEHLHAWFVNPKTKMQPHLLYAQAIKGRNTGRSIGGIDAVHLVEVALAVERLSQYKAIDAGDLSSIKQWFAQFSSWMTSHPYGLKERDHPNNHSIAWSLQIAAYSKLTNNLEHQELVKDYFKQWYLAKMMSKNGSFPKETERTKPYAYSLFVMDLMAGIAQILTTQEENLWLYETENQRSLKLGVDFMAGYINDKMTWPFAPDVEYWKEWPLRHPFMVFAALQLNDCRYYSAVTTLENTPNVYEIKRNFPIRHLLLWIN